MYILSICTPYTRYIPKKYETCYSTCKCNLDDCLDMAYSCGHAILRLGASKLRRSENLGGHLSSIPIPGICQVYTIYIPHFGIYLAYTRLKPRSGFQMMHWHPSLSRGAFCMPCLSGKECKFYFQY